MLEVEGLVVGGGARVGGAGLDGVRLHVATGEVVAVLGPPGAGKTLLWRCLAGLVTPDAGSIRVQGRELGGVTAQERLRAGLVAVPAGGGVFAGLTLRENLLLGATWRARGERDATLRRVLGVLPGLVPGLDKPAGALPAGLRGIAGLARGLMALPRVLVVDEPAIGPVGGPAALAAVRGLDGVSVLLLGAVGLPLLSVAQRGYRLDRGQIIGEGRAEALAGAIRAGSSGVGAES